MGNNAPVSIADEVPFEIPDSWEWVRLSTIIELQSGQDLTPNNYNDKGLGIPYITGASNIEAEKIIINRWTENGRAFAYNGDLLLTCKGTVGTMAFLQEDVVHIARQIMAIRSFDGVNPLYIRIVLETLVENLKASAKSMIPGISRDDVLNAIFPLPPSGEQNRIVSKVKDIRPLTDQYAIKNEKINDLNNLFPEHLKKSILQEAVMGKLVPQEPNDEPASVLLEKIRTEKQRLIAEGKLKKDKHESVIYRRDNSHYEKRDGKDLCIDDEIPYEIPETWEWVRLKDLCTKIGSGSTPTGGKANYVNKGIKFLRSQNIYNDGIHEAGLVYITEAVNNQKTGSIVYPNDILLNITGGSIGRCAIVPESFDIGNVNQHVMIIRLLDVNLRNWVHTVIISPYIQMLIMDVQVGVSREGLSASKLMDFFIPIPPQPEMSRILNTIDDCTKLLS